MLRTRNLFPIFLCIAFIISITQAYTITSPKLIAFEKAASAYSKALQNADANAILNAIPPPNHQQLNGQKKSQ